MTSRLPILKPAELVSALKRAGLVEVRQSGSHVIMWKEGLPRPVPVPLHQKDLKRALQSNIIKEAGFTEEQFQQYL